MYLSVDSGMGWKGTLCPFVVGSGVLMDGLPVLNCWEHDKASAEKPPGELINLA